MVYLYKRYHTAHQNARKAGTFSPCYQGITLEHYGLAAKPVSVAAAFCVALLVTVIGYLCVFAVDAIFKTDFRIWTFAFKTFEPSAIPAAVIANRLSQGCADFLTCDKNANCYNFYFTNAARTVTITIKAVPKGRSFSSTVRNRSDSAGAAQNALIRRFFA